jgi:hypothetical protein
MIVKELRSEHQGASADRFHELWQRFWKLDHILQNKEEEVREIEIQIAGYHGELVLEVRQELSGY